MRRALTIVAVVLLGVPACGGGTDEAATPDLKAVDFGWEPAELTLTVDDLEVFVANTGKAAHNLTIEGLEVDADLQPGEQAAVAVLQGGGTGEFPFFCAFHPEQMVGQLTIE